jgi:DNA polymerase-3 subunit alpha
MRYELGVIKSMGYPSYFVIVAKMIEWARSHSIPVGPGRGSGAGSLVAYCLGITDLDPIKNGLIFERFLNPDRVSPPDFDCDLCEKRRHEVVQYLVDTYGADRVAKIGTFGTLRPKALLKDAAKALGKPWGEANWLTGKLSPTADWDEAMAVIADDLVSTPSWAAEVATVAAPMSGIKRHAGTHACGIIIGDRELAGLVPLSTDKEGSVVTQFEGGPCESMGLLKLDVLGLKTLTIIDECIKLTAGANNGN